MASFTLKEGMLLGTASAATQIEGGAPDHSWMNWSRRGHIKDGTSPARADDHYNRWPEDDQLMADMGMQIVRIGVEWARIEPQNGVFDQDAISYYVEEVRWLNAHHIKPLVTLHHFTNPMWFEKLGAFAKRRNVPYFMRFVTRMVQAFGTEVTEYITINEPNVYAMLGYYTGEWPPGRKRLFKATHVMSVLAVAHVQAYQLIHALQRGMGAEETRVSYALNMQVNEPQNPNKLSHRLGAYFADRFFQDNIMQAMELGVFRWPIRNLGKIKKGLYCDFIALNYYTRATMAGLKRGTRKGVPVNDLGWEIYPQGMIDCLRRIEQLHTLPIYITENGTCDNQDAFRSRFLFDHLQALCQSMLPVKRYYHWCFTDNFEWAEGESARFGLVRVDYETQKRTVKQSGSFFSEIIKQGGVTEPMYAQCVQSQTYTVSAK
ncbi:MAG TPA: family 1 glycosylhydrolase [Candidatus Limiplasma sp.]|nr:family 1 glycosylhydrolase [Candidatus Limiplasma sp.]